ncbi:MAG: hypothetical protein LQ339_006040 [Xanthoria mediterranea]|nr:MAG: hypothetical protein LQ339_006040 [Xanthoria mediterranea]
MSNPAVACLVGVAKDSFLQWLLRNKDSGNFTDFTIACGKLEWKVHRVVICSHSDYFRRLEGFEEGKTSRLDLQEENPAVVAKLVNYLYTCDYDDCVFDFPGHDSEDSNAKESEEASNEDSRERSKSQAFKPGELALHARMYVVGDMYCVDQLKLLAKAKFSAALVNDWDKEDFPEIIRFIYDNTVSSDRGLRESLVPTLLQHKEILRADDTFMNVVETHGEFARDLINAWTNPNHRPRAFFKCDYCDRLYPNSYVGHCAGENCTSYGRRSFRTLYMGI